MSSKKLLGITVIMPHKNDSQVISAALDSICRQERLPDQVLVIDDCSENSQRNLLDGIILKYRKVLPIVWVNSVGTGLAAARNTGIFLAQYTLVAFLDCDDTWRSDKLKLQINSFEKNCAAIHSWCIDVYPSGQETLLRPTVNYTQKNLVKGSYSVTGSSSSILLATELALKVGGFDENLEFGEDVDMWVRISEYGKIKCIDQALVKINRRENGTQRKLNFKPDIKIASHEKMIMNWRIKGIINKKFAFRILSIRLLAVTSEFSRNSNKTMALKFLLKYIVNYSRKYESIFYFTMIEQFFLKVIRKLNGSKL